MCEEALNVASHSVNFPFLNTGYVAKNDIHKLSSALVVILLIISNFWEVGKTIVSQK